MVFFIVVADLLSWLTVFKQYLKQIKYEFSTYSINCQIYTANNHSEVIRSDFIEITNLRIINQLKENLQNNEFCILNKYNKATDDLIFIKKFVSKINEFEVNARNGLNSNDMEEIKYTLSDLKTKVRFVARILYFRAIV